MSKSECAVFTNMCMLFDDAGRILVQDRKSKDWPGLTFPGGKVEKNESFVASVIREVKEETGLTIMNPHLCGIKQFQDEKDARYVVLFYQATAYTGELESSDEGEVFWINREDLNNYQLAEDFEGMLEVFESEQMSEFYYREDGTFELY
ncbi:8-oxo-dGTP diphosphatase [Jeotgalibaca porci]|uniref:8-oxo-dGTP diphosphatase n=1 Tax=Jeotgalibaca porci TaxID=1868793 RepID=A0A6G7WGD3_9LACT|nr:8-oxo-dGTP diphosphatase [Jeotgalibaca porci]QIK51316.1 8-oxo-dGTP diphosphatase [Jeotgalibaca porci]